MISIIPAPKKLHIKQEAHHTVRFAVCCAHAPFRPQMLAFADTFFKGFGRSLATDIAGGIEILFDGTLAANTYRLCTDGTMRIYACSEEGVAYGLATALQLCEVTEEGIALPTLTIEDYPDKDYRSIMVDIGREWHPFDKLLKFVDLCYFYKVRYLNLHFADNKLYTLPSRAFPKLCVEGRCYTEEQIGTLRAYAAARGVVLIPEFECPGHAPVLNTYYPEVFADESDGEGGAFYNEAGEIISNKSLLCAGSERAVEGVKTLLREICELFPEAPYIHIGGDEANIALWAQCAACRAYMAEHGIDDVYGLYSDYVARITSYVLSLGKRPIVWEGFPEKGSDAISRETVVISWENHYQTTEQLLAAGFPIINASWKPLYIVPAMNSATPMFAWNARDVFEWNVYNWQHWWSQSSATLNPVNVQPTEQVIGAMLCAWEMTFEQEIGSVMTHLAALSERTWTVRRTRSYDDFRGQLGRLFDLSARIIQDR